VTPTVKVRAERSTLDAARAYVQRGWSVIPVPRGEKAPHIAGWPSLRLGECDLSAHFSNGKNVGVILGSASGGLCDVDLDSPEALAAADFFLPPTGFVFGRAQKPRSHRFYRCDVPPTPEKLSAPDGGTLIELRAAGQQTILPPSIHPSGELYRLEEDGDTAHVDGEDLARRVRLVAAAALLARHWPARGARHDCALALAGMLLRAGNSEEDVVHFVEAVTLAAGDEETRARVRDVLTTAKRIAAGRPATGAPTLAEIVGDEIVCHVREWLRLEKKKCVIYRCRTLA
jgi:hypothetical protein